MANESLHLLIYLAKEVGFNNKKLISTMQISKELNFSQQTASRKLIELEQKGYIIREASINGVNIVLTNKAKKEIEDNYVLLKSVLENNSNKLNGMVTTGIGEGKFYVQIKKYNEEFTKLLDGKPFPGTLNLIVKGINAKEFLLGKELTRVKGFSTKIRTFGSIDFYKVKINGKVDGAIIVPERTTHPENVIEIIAPDYLRDILNLKDNDKITLE